MIKKILTVLVVLFALTGCQSQSNNTVTPSASNQEETAQSANWLGTWTRISLRSPAYSSNDPATLTLNQDSYTSATAACATSGSVKSADGTFTLIMLESSCPGGVQPPFTTTYSFTINEDEDGHETMTTVTSVVTEVYVRSDG